MNLSSQFRSCRAPSTNRPNRFVREKNTRELGRGQRSQAAFELTLEHILRMVGFAVGKHFADADDGSESGLERGFRLEMHRFVRFIEILPALGVADDALRCSRPRPSCAAQISPVNAPSGEP